MIQRLIQPHENRQLQEKRETTGRRVVVVLAEQLHLRPCEFFLVAAVLLFERRDLRLNRLHLGRPARLLDRDRKHGAADDHRQADDGNSPASEEAIEDLQEHQHRPADPVKHAEVDHLGRSLGEHVVALRSGKQVIRMGDGVRVACRLCPCQFRRGERQLDRREFDADIALFFQVRSEHLLCCRSCVRSLRLILVGGQERREKLDVDADELHRPHPFFDLVLCDRLSRQHLVIDPAILRRKSHDDVAKLLRILDVFERQSGRTLQYVVESALLLAAISKRQFNLHRVRGGFGVHRCRIDHRQLVSFLELDAVQFQPENCRGMHPVLRKQLDHFPIQLSKVHAGAELRNGHLQSFEDARVVPHNRQRLVRLDERDIAGIVERDVLDGCTTRRQGHQLTIPFALFKHDRSQFDGRIGKLG